MPRQYLPIYAREYTYLDPIDGPANGFRLFEAGQGKYFNESKLIQHTYYETSAGTLTSEAFRKNIMDCYEMKSPSNPVLDAEQQSLYTILLAAANISSHNLLTYLINVNHKIPPSILQVLKKHKDITTRPSVLSMEEAGCLTEFIDGYLSVFGYPSCGGDDAIDLGNHIVAQILCFQQQAKKTDFLNNSEVLTNVARELVQRQGKQYQVRFQNKSQAYQQTINNLKTLLERGADPTKIIINNEIPIDVFNQYLPSLSQLSPGKFARFILLLLTTPDIALALAKMRSIFRAKLNCNISLYLGTFLHEAIAYELHFVPELLDVMQEEKIPFDINARDFRGSTPLILAAKTLQYESVKAILAFPGVDVYAEDEFGCTALDYAVAFGQTKMVELLKKYSYRWLLTSAIQVALDVDDDFIIKTLADVFIHPFRDTNASSNAMYLLEESDPYYNEGKQYLLSTKENYLKEYERIKNTILENARRINFLQMYDLIAFYNRYSTVSLSPKVKEIKARFEERVPKEEDIKAIFTQLDAMIASLSGIPLIEHCMAERNTLLAQLLCHSTNATAQKVHDAMTELATSHYESPTFRFNGGKFFLTTHAQNKLLDQDARLGSQADKVYAVR